MNNPECALCAPSEGIVIAQNELAHLLSDPFSSNPLHAVVAPKVHRESLLGDLTGEEWLAMQGLARVFSDRVREEHGYTDFTIGADIGEAAGAIAEHTHLVFATRYQGDEGNGATNSIGGVRGVIPGQADYKAPDYRVISYNRD